MVNSSTSSSRRVFFLKLAAFLLLVAALDFGLGNLLRHFYFTQKYGLNQLTTYALNESMDPIIVLGSSRAQAHYVPTIMEEGLGGSCFNAGRNGQSMLFSGAVFRSVSSRQTPEIVVLDLILSDFFENSQPYDRLSVLLPYYDGTEAVRPFVRMRSPLEQVKMLSRIYPFNSLPLQIIKYNLGGGKSSNGFVPQHGAVQLPMPPPVERRWVRNQMDDKVLDTFTEVVADCQKRGIDLYVIISPLFDGLIFGEKGMARIESILAESPFTLWDFSKDPDFLMNPDLFKDRDHLNEKGARAFTRMVTERILAQRGGMRITAGEGSSGGNGGATR